MLEVKRRRERDFGHSSASVSGASCCMADYENDLECDSLYADSDEQPCCELAAEEEEQKPAQSGSQSQDCTQEIPVAGCCITMVYTQ